jgi:transposase-like protein
MLDFALELFGLDHLVEQVSGWLHDHGLLGRSESAPPSRGVALFLSGRTVRQVAAALNPGVGGPPIILTQDAIEGQIRGYVEQLRQENDELRQENAELQRENEMLQQALAGIEQGEQEESHASQ